MPDQKYKRASLIAAGVIALACLIAYGNSLFAPFVFDSASVVAFNPTIRQFGSALRPPHDGSTVDGRPLLNLSLALNYAISGTQPWSYHALNLLIHILAAATLFGVVRRTLERSGMDGPPGTKAELRARAARPYIIAFAAALFWALHPLQTEAVTYVIQRAESMMGLFYLLTLYCFIRHAEEEGDGIWAVLSFLACLFGMATKEVMATAPVLVFLYDRTFIGGGFKEAWRRRKKVHLGLASTWILLLFLEIGTGGRNGTAGFGAHLRWSDYLLTQIYAVAHYLRLAAWPHPQIFDYGTAVVTQPALVMPAAIAVALLLAGTVAALVRRPVLGFLGCWFLGILAPSSLVPVATQTIAEHRMYLPLAALMVILAAALARLPGRSGRAAILALALVLGALTAHRNNVYASEVALWSDNVAKRPDDSRAFNNLGNAFYGMDKIPEAAEQYRRALQLKPEDNPEAQYNLGTCLLRENRLPEAIPHLAEAVRLAPDNAGAHNNLGKALAESGRLPEALEQFQAVLRINSNDAEAHNNLGTLWYLMGRRSDAIAEYREALRIKPDFADARASLDHIQASP